MKGKYRVFVVLYASVMDLCQCIDGGCIVLVTETYVRYIYLLKVCTQQEVINRQ